MNDIDPTKVNASEDDIQDDDDESDSGDEDTALQSGDDLATAALASASGSTLSRTMSAASKLNGDPNEIAQTLTALQNVIERNAELLDEIKDELRVHKEKLQNVMENDTELATATEEAKKFGTQVKERRTKLMSSPEVVDAKSHITELTERKKETEDALNNHLLNYYQMTGVKVFDTSSGHQREFSIRATLKSKKNQE